MLEGPSLIRGGSLFCGGGGGEGGRGEFPPLSHHKRGIFPSFAVGERGKGGFSPLLEWEGRGGSLLQIDIVIIKAVCKLKKTDVSEEDCVPL